MSEELQTLILRRITEVQDSHGDLTKEVVALRIQVEHRLTKIETKTTIRAAVSGAVTSVLLAVAGGLAFLLGR